MSGASFAVRMGALAGSCLLLCQPALAASTERISVSSAEAQANDLSEWPSVSADGRFVAFSSLATNLVAGDTNGFSDIFVRDRLTGATERVSVSSAGIQADWYSTTPSISASGRYVAFTSRARNLVAGDTNNVEDVFVRDRATGTTEQVSVSGEGAHGDNLSVSPSISADGRYVAFLSSASNLIPGDPNPMHFFNAYVKDRQTGNVERISFATDGALVSNCDDVRISGDGRFVVFRSLYALVAGDTNGTYDVFVRDRVALTTTRASLGSAGAQANGASFYTAINADGRFVAFAADATNLVAGDTNGVRDVFVRDRLTGTTERVNVNSAEGQAGGGSIISFPSISADGRIVIFDSFASDLVAGDTNGDSDVFVRDRQAGTTARVSVDSAGAQANDHSYSYTVSADGRFVGFHSTATNLVAGDTNALQDVFLRDRGPVADEHNDLLVDLGSPGLFLFLNNTTWDRIHSISPIAIASGDLDGTLKDEAIASLTGLGLYARYDSGVWRKLYPTAITKFVSGDLDGNGSDELVADLGAPGLYAFFNNTTWTRLYPSPPVAFATGDLNGNGKDEVIASLSGLGLYVRYDSGIWRKIYPTAPTRFVTGDIDGSGRDDLIVDLGASGLYVFRNNTIWVKLYPSSPLALATGDLNGNGLDEVIASFSGLGLYVRYDNGTWRRIYPTAVTRFVAADLDNSGKEDLAVDLGTSGLWVRYNDLTWTKRYPSAIDGLAAGGFD